MGLVIVGIGIAIAGYFIGDGLKNFRNPNAKGLFQRLDDEDDHELIVQSDAHHYIGVSKEDAKQLLNNHPDIPHIMLNEKAYFPKSKLREWVRNAGS